MVVKAVIFILALMAGIGRGNLEIAIDLFKGEKDNINIFKCCTNLQYLLGFDVYTTTQSGGSQLEVEIGSEEDFIKDSSTHTIFSFKRTCNCSSITDGVCIMYAAIAKEEPFSVHCQVDHNEYGVISSDALEIYKFRPIKPLINVERKGENLLLFITFSMDNNVGPYNVQTVEINIMDSNNQSIHLVPQSPIANFYNKTSIEMPWKGESSMEFICTFRNKLEQETSFSNKQTNFGQEVLNFGVKE